MPAEFVVLMQERAKTLNEIRAAYEAYIEPELPRYDPKSVAKQLIPEAKLELVFEPYVQLHQGRGVKAGRGLGLAIVRGLDFSSGWSWHRSVRMSATARAFGSSCQPRFGAIPPGGA